jgi:NADH dehydrogenase FAD-containing subunit
MPSFSVKACIDRSGTWERLFTNDQLQVLDLEGKPVPDVWAIGDAAIVKSDGPPLPATAQVASQKAQVKQQRRPERERKR